MMLYFSEYVYVAINVAIKLKTFLSQNIEHGKHEVMTVVMRWHRSYLNICHQSLNPNLNRACKYLRLKSTQSKSNLQRVQLVLTEFIFVLSHYKLFYFLTHCRPLGPGCVAPPDFFRSVNSISTRRPDYAHHITTARLPLPPDFQTFLHPCIIGNSHLVNMYK